MGEPHRSVRRRPTQTVLVAMVALGVGLLLALLLPVGLRAVDGAETAECEIPIALRISDTQTITRVLEARDDFPTQLIVDADAVFSKIYTFDTDLDSDTASAMTAFVVDARLRDGGGSVVDGGIVASAAAHDDDELDVRLCVDPTPHGESLPPGQYNESITFNDVRIPKTTVRTAVLITEPDKSSFELVVIVFGALLVLCLPLPVVLGSLATNRSVRAELVAARWLLAGLAIVCLVGYGVATWVFTDTDAYRTWTASSGEDIRQFVYHGYRGAAAGFGVVGGALGLMPKARELLTKTVSSPDTQSPARTPDTAPTHRPDERPRGAARSRRNWVVPSVVAAFAFGTLVAVVIAANNNSDSQQSSGPSSTEADIDRTTPTADPTTTVGRNSTTVAQTSPAPPVRLDRVLAEVEVGETQGAVVADLLLREGFGVAAYQLCSDSVRTVGALRQVRDSRTEIELLGANGLTEAASDVVAPDSVDVLVASGRACEG